MNKYNSKFNEIFSFCCSSCRKWIHQQLITVLRNSLQQLCNRFIFSPLSRNLSDKFHGPRIASIKIYVCAHLTFVNVKSSQTPAMTSSKFCCTAHECCSVFQYKNYLGSQLGLRDLSQSQIFACYMLWWSLFIFKLVTFEKQYDISSVSNFSGSSQTNISQPQ